ncbi:MAG: PKD domain-containing protein, partial [Cytophagales bacterium]
MRIFLMYFCIGLFLNQTLASHLIGGELYYKKISADIYQVEFKAYRDCINGLIGFDDPLAISVFDMNDVYQGFIRIPFNFAETLPLRPVTPCAGVPDNVCVEETKYVTNVYLPPKVGGYKLVYQRCCRNQTIQNIQEPELTGTTYFVKIFGSESPFFENSSPQFKNFPPIFLCANDKLEFDHSATDLDGDSLVYELVTPWVGGDTSRFNARPLPAGVPPFNEVVWKNPYSLQNSMGGVDPIKIDRRTGLLTGTPPNIGQYVLGVAVSEYRAGRLIQRHIRDFQFNVVDCPPPPTAVLPDIINNCGVLTVFANNSISATNFFWDFGDPTTENDFSYEKFPRYVYPSPGEYNIRLIVSDNRPECADTTSAKVIIIKNPDGANFTVSPVCQNQQANFKDASILDIGNPVRWTWNLENNFVNESNGNVLYRFSRAGNFNVKMIVFNEDGCSDTITKPVTIYPLPEITLKKNDTICFGESKTIQVVTNASIFSWNNSPNLSCTNCLQTVISPSTMSNQSYVFNAISNQNCQKSDTIRIFTPFLIANAGNDTTVCPSSSAQLRGQGGVRYLWQPSNLVTCDTCRTTLTKNLVEQKFLLEVRDRFNCKSFDSVKV